MTVKITGIPWYKKEDYGRIISISEDGNIFAPRYEDWLDAAENVEYRLKASGVRVIRAEINPDTFPAWCASNRVNVNAEGRTTFANHIAKAAFDRQVDN